MIIRDVNWELTSLIITTITISHNHHHH